MKNSVWAIICLFLIMIIITFFSLNKNQKRIIAYQNQEIEALRGKNKNLEQKQENLDWLKSELEAIDNYISVVDQLKFSADKNFPGIERTVEELNKTRFEVIKNAVYWDREINKREEVK